jgi:glycosyltransferase involved in cell wall biosynthesis
MNSSNTMLLKVTKPLFKFSFIITTRNNLDELRRTISSIVPEAPKGSEMVIVDGNDIPFERSFLTNMIGDSKITLTIALDKKIGVYEAMNVGIEGSHGEWIVMVTAGDYLISGAKILLESIENSDKDAVIFAQNVEDQSGNIAYSFYPTKTSVWPHQSVIFKRQVHENHGLYLPKYKYSSDQHLFAEVRKAINYELRKEILTVFCLGGITSGASLSRSKEVFLLRHKLGENIFEAFMKSHIFPFVRYYLEKYALMRPVAMVLRKIFFSYYVQPQTK